MAKTGNAESAGAGKSKPRLCPECESPVRHSLTECEICGASLKRGASAVAPRLPQPVKKSASSSRRSRDSAKERQPQRRSEELQKQADEFEKQEQLASVMQKAALVFGVVVVFGGIVWLVRRVPEGGVGVAVADAFKNPGIVDDVSDIAYDSEAFFQELGAHQDAWSPPANPNGGKLIDYGWYSAGFYDPGSELSLGRTDGVSRVRWKGVFREVAINGHIEIDVPGADVIVGRPLIYGEAIDPGLQKGLRTVVDRLYVQIDYGNVTSELNSLLTYTGTAWMDVVIEDAKQRKLPDNPEILEYFQDLLDRPYFSHKEKAAEVIEVLKSLPPEPKRLFGEFRGTLLPLGGPGVECGHGNAAHPLRPVARHR